MPRHHEMAEKTLIYSREKSFNLSLFVGVSLPCSAGYICLQGSDIPNPADNVKGYICPVGHYCLEGAVKETKCDIGTYGPTEGLGKLGG